ncbi:MAG TPA: outer membrane lipoprotein carrier protein LolA [Candidatus Polarisedimenticolia bacterium]|jgi:outer membrane lipoprotein carrier protein|nr:outer membrane lipoprotein carrier protein LolA [Candidatus Polarisedimenticolia bacterium]
MRRDSRWLGLVAIVSAFLGPAATRSEAGSPAATTAQADAVEEARRVEAALNGVTGLVASFTQTVESPGLPRPQVEKGTVYLLRPGRMRFEYDVPKGKLAIADGRRTYLYLPEERQVVVAPLDPRSPGSGVSILLNRIDLVANFSIGWGPGPERGPHPLMLSPRAPRPEYEFLLLTTGPDRLVKSLTIVEPLGSRVTYRLERIRRVDTLPDDLFEFTPPAGIEVQEVGPS